MPDRELVNQKIASSNEFLCLFQGIIKEEDKHFTGAYQE